MKKKRMKKSYNVSLFLVTRFLAWLGVLGCPIQPHNSVTYLCGYLLVQVSGRNALWGGCHLRESCKLELDVPRKIPNAGSLCRQRKVLFAEAIRENENEMSFRFTGLKLRSNFFGIP